jgi:PPM family protein phosphatase
MSKVNDCRLIVASDTDTGVKRKNNEDSIDSFTLRGRQFLLLADGMGGEEGGEIASRTAIQAAGKYLKNSQERDPRQLIQNAIHYAHRDLTDLKAQRAPNLSRMGTTLVIAILDGAYCWWGHVGDSRVYLLSPNRTCQVSVDQTRVNEMVRRGEITAEQARVHPDRHILTCALGVSEKLQIQIGNAPLSLEKSESVLLCSDGLSDLVSDHELSRVVDRFGPHKALPILVNTAKSRGGHDNISLHIAYWGAVKQKWSRLPRRKEIPGGRPQKSGGRRTVAWIALFAALVLAAGSFAGWKLWPRKLPALPTPALTYASGELFPRSTHGSVEAVQEISGANSYMRLVYTPPGDSLLVVAIEYSGLGESTAHHWDLSYKLSSDERRILSVNGPGATGLFNMPDSEDSLARCVALVSRSKAEFYEDGLESWYQAENDTDANIHSVELSLAMPSDSTLNMQGMERLSAWVVAPNDWQRPIFYLDALQAPQEVEESGEQPEGEVPGDGNPGDQAEDPLVIEAQDMSEEGDSTIVRVNPEDAVQEMEPKDD